jgi:Fur family ferric uptake transcriptional regulator
MAIPEAAQRSEAVGLDEALQRVRAHGGRLTAAKRTLLVGLHDEPDRITAADLVERHPGIDPATIYRALHQFESAGVIEHAHLGHGPAVYRWVRERSVPAVCEVCGGVTDLPRRELHGLAQRLREGYGLELALGHFALTVRCARCLDDGARRPAARG